ncbi:MAG TPA: FKBP-type peptidyl-prolyl cis-trans isomerase [Verrucomicrobiae bacterium]|nr:FKBP-type peptidyl-prolyl cis-trans isomerase [Verrucomicrobiae bacterium]
MKTINYLTTISSLTLAALWLPCSTARAQTANGTNVLSDTKDRTSYAIGMTMGERLRQQEIDLNQEMFVRGFEDAQKGTNTLLSEQEMRDTLNQFQREMMAKQQKLHEEQLAKNKKESAEFLTANKTKPGIETLPDGLQYKVITNGDGEIPAADDTVTVNYTGTLIDGTEFDSSVKRGKPATFKVGGVIHGWTEALEKMKVGSKWQLFIPSDLAYGDYGRPPQIPPGATLIFDVELLSVEHPKPMTSDIIKVPSAEEMKNGAKVEIIKPEDAEKLQNQTTSQSK